MCTQGLTHKTHFQIPFPQCTQLPAPQHSLYIGHLCCVMLPPAQLHDARVAARPVPVPLRQLCEELVLLPLCAHNGGC
jgi:hypothetical protein